MKTPVLFFAMSVCTLSAQETKPSAPPAESAKDGVQHVDAAGAKKLLDNKDSKVVVLDVRTPDEYKAGHLTGAVNVDFLNGKFADEIAKLDKEKTYVVHCQSGGRSTRSLEAFKKLGFKSIVHLDGGYAGWVKAKLPITK